MKQKVTAVFDIGKTNKKFFLFDKDFKEVHKEYISFDEIKDEDGHPTEDIHALHAWLKEVFNRILKAEKFNIKAINFSTYGASFVHLDENGEILTPLYNYTKEIENEVADRFYKEYGNDLELVRSSGSTRSPGLLNSGLQLYWLKHYKPEIFSKIKYSLHLPQYLSYVFTGIPLSEYTSIGCHTSLWNYETKDYQDWVYKEEINKILPPIVSTETSLNINYNGKRIKIGVGIHDSSSALLPYVRSVKKPFVLVSTGTWSIALNPFTDTPLTVDDVNADCLNYMRINGKPVKSARLFLGNEYKIQVEKLRTHYGKKQGYHRKIKFDNQLFSKLKKSTKKYFKLESINGNSKKNTKTDLSKFSTFKEAFHQLMIELMELQIQTVKLAIGNSSINKIFIDGGFADNDLFVKMIAHHFKNYKIRTTQSPLGSALGAAMIVSEKKVKKNFLKKHYAMKKQLTWK